MTILKLSEAMGKGSESGGLIRSQVCLLAVGGILIPPPVPTSEGGGEEKCNESKQSPSQGFSHLPQGLIAYQPPPRGPLSLEG